jgi:tRNA-dihydrouridine synthase A
VFALVGDDIEHTLPAFIEIVADAGVKKFIIHARFAQIGKLSPKENRTKLPLYPEKVFEIKKKYPELEIIFNGEICSISQIQELNGKTDGVMIGRAAYTNPYFLSEVDSLFYGDNTPIPSRKEVAFSMMDYLDLQEERAPHLFRHLMGLYYGTEVARIWRSTLMSKNTNEVRRTLDGFLF